MTQTSSTKLQQRALQENPTYDELVQLGVSQEQAKKKAAKLPDGEKETIRRLQSKAKSGRAFLTCSLCEMHIHTYFGLIRLIISKKKLKTFSSDEILNPGKTSDLIQEHYADRSVNMYISNLVSIYILKSGVD